MRSDTVKEFAESTLQRSPCNTAILTLEDERRAVSAQVYKLEPRSGGESAEIGNRAENETIRLGRMQGDHAENGLDEGVT